MPAFKAVVRGEVKRGDELVPLLTHNEKGLFARIEGSEKSLAPLGPGLIGQTLRHCDPNRNALPRPVTIAGVGYTLASTCKPHDCAEHNLVLLWNPRQERVFGLVQQRRSKTLVGAPPAALASELEKLWAQEWRTR